MWVKSVHLHVLCIFPDYLLLVCKVSIDVLLHHWWTVMQGVEQIRVDGESKLNDVETLSKAVLSQSSLSGQEIILREVERCKSDWNGLVSAISQVGVKALFVYISWRHTHPSGWLGIEYARRMSSYSKLCWLVCSSCMPSQMMAGRYIAYRPVRQTIGTAAWAAAAAAAIMSHTLITLAAVTIFSLFCFWNCLNLVYVFASLL